MFSIWGLLSSTGFPQNKKVNNCFDHTQRGKQKKSLSFCFYKYELRRRATQLRARRIGPKRGDALDCCKSTDSDHSLTLGQSEADVTKRNSFGELRSKENHKRIGSRGM